MGKGKHNKNRSKKSRKQQAKGGGVSGLTTVRMGLPDRFMTTMVYGTYLIQPTVAGAQVWNSYRGNSVFDPDFSGAGTTAFTYTQLSAVYNRYRVLSSRAIVEVINSGTVPCRIALMATIDNAPPVATYVIGQRHIAQGMIGTTGTVGWKHTATATTAAIFGVPKAQVMAEDDFAGLVGGNPNNGWYWHVVFFNPGAVAGAVNLSIRIEYTVAWSMPLLIAP